MTNQRIKLIRTLLGFTQKEFAEKLGIEYSSYVEYESGLDVPDICEWISQQGISFFWLYFGHKGMFINSEKCQVFPISSDLTVHVKKDNDKISLRLKELRKILRIYQREFAKILGIRQKTYSAYESGDAEIPDEIILKLHKLGINLNWLIAGQGLVFIERPSNLEHIRLKKVRKKLEVTEERLASFLGTDPYTYYLWETGERCMPDCYKIKLSKLGINLHWFLTGKGPMLEQDHVNDTEENKQK